jgi:hypothetical protein
MANRVILTPLPPTDFGPLNLGADTHIGKRKNQEDRLVFEPAMCDGQCEFAAACTPRPSPLARILRRPLVTLV